VLPVVWLAGIGAWMASGITLLLYSPILNLTAHLHIPDQIAIDFVRMCDQLVIFSVFALPVALSVGWAINKGERFIAFGSIIRCGIHCR